MEVEDQVCLTYKANKEYIHVSYIRHTYKEVSVWKLRTRSVSRIRQIKNIYTYKASFFICYSLFAFFICLIRETDLV